MTSAWKKTSPCDSCKHRPNPVIPCGSPLSAEDGHKFVTDEEIKHIRVNAKEQSTATTWRDVPEPWKKVIQSKNKQLWRVVRAVFDQGTQGDLDDYLEKAITLLELDEPPEKERDQFFEVATPTVTRIGLLSGGWRDKSSKLVIIYDPSLG